MATRAALLATAQRLGREKFTLHDQLVASADRMATFYSC